MRSVLLLLAIYISLASCREELYTLPPPTDPPRLNQTEPSCQAPAIEENIIGTWQFETIPSAGEVIRKGMVTFTTQRNMVDPDSLYANYIDTGSAMAKVVTKTYDPEGDYPATVYKGKVFRVDLIIKDGRSERWPMYVFSNECKRIVIYRVSTYNLPVKIGFVLTRP